jgi:hypothetical protein
MKHPPMAKAAKARKIVRKAKPTRKAGKQPGLGPASFQYRSDSDSRLRRARSADGG